ncbi:MAG: hypothetical protein AB7U35_05580 [Sphingobium sp.]
MAILVGVAAPSAALAEAGCYDVKVRARPVDQIPSDIGDCGSDCILMSWPWFVDLQVNRIMDGTLSSRMVRVLSIQHTYRALRQGSWLLRKNAAGGYNVLASEDGAALPRCSAEQAPAEPYIRAGGGHSLDDLRDAGVRRYGHHTN